MVVSGLLEVLLRNMAQGFSYATAMILRNWNFTGPCGQEGKCSDEYTDANTTRDEDHNFQKLCFYFFSHCDVSYIAIF